MRRSPLLSRRDLIALGASGLVAPSRALAKPLSSSDRKFLFVYVRGGWDTYMTFTPPFTSTKIDFEPDATLATVNGIPFVDSAKRPSVRAFFEQHGHRCCVVNGMEVRSVTHERCLGILMTGGSAGGKDDWPAVIAGNAQFSPMIPELVLSGPSFTSQYSSDVVRIGPQGQFTNLLDGTAFTRMDAPIPPPSAGSQALEDAFVRQRVADHANAAAAGRPKQLADDYGAMLDQLAMLDTTADMDLSPEGFGCSRDIASDAASAFDAFELGAARVAMTQDDGWCAVGWDTHSQGQDQTRHYEQLFVALDALLVDLDGRVGLSGSPLSEEVTIVVLSEMGRYPRFNATQGRDHWTFTSFLLIGAGVRGGQAIGAIDDLAAGRPVDLASGEVTDSGTRLIPGNLGATLLALADVDPGPWAGESAPITAALESP